MNQQEYIDLLNRELKELADLLSGMNECAVIPSVFLNMARDKALRMADGFDKLALMRKSTEGACAEIAPRPVVPAEIKPEEVKPREVTPVVADVTPAPVETARVTPAQTAPARPATTVNLFREQTSHEESVKAVAEPVKVQSAEPVSKGPEKKDMPVKEAFEPVFREFTQAPVKSAAKHDIRSLMTLNDRFLFQRELFRGDIGLLNYTLDEMNKRSSLDEAHAFLEKEYKWDPEASGVKEFIDLVERHFNGTII